MTSAEPPSAGRRPDSVSSKGPAAWRALCALVLVFLLLGSLGCGTVLSGLVPDELRTDRPGHELPVLPPYDVLGPIGAVAVSPFYSMALLSGLAILSDRGVFPANEFLRRNRLLKRPALFLVFAVLAILVSLPRFTKLTNTFGTALGYLEDRAVLISLIALHAVVLFDRGAGGVESVTALSGWQPIVREALVAVLAVLNFVVLRSIRFYVDLVILISPIPFVDGLLETFKKAAATFLLLLYAYFPGAAAILNLVLLLLGLLVFFQVVRLTRFYLEVLIWPTLRRLRETLGLGRARASARKLPWSIRRRYPEAEIGFAMFPLRRFSAVPAKARLWFLLTEDSALLLRRGWLRRNSFELLAPATRISLGRAFMYNQCLVEFPDGSRVELAFSHEYDFLYERLLDRLDAADRGSLGFKKGLDKLRDKLRPAFMQKADTE